MKFFIPVSLVSFLMLQGCVSTTAVWKDKSYQPVKKGTLFYNPVPNLLDKEAVQKRRADAKMKMEEFCSPQAPVIVAERNAEEVTGHRTSYSSSRDNPNPTYKSRSSTYSRGGSFVSERSASETGKPVLYSSGSATSTAIVRKRVYIDFTCK